MENFICVQCGTQFSETVKPPLHCPICEDERQFVRHSGQEWITLKHLAADHQNRFEEEAPQLLGIGSEPEFAIGQRDRKSTRLISSHVRISYAVFCLKKKKNDKSTDLLRKNNNLADIRLTK